MLRKSIAAAVIAAAVAATLSATRAERATAAKGPHIGHMVFFKLKDAAPAARAKLVEACDKYLSGHDGTVYYSAGVLANEFKREVNDRDWDVALHLVFEDKAAHDKYADHPRHVQFIDENKANWDKVRVFDSEVTPKAK